MGACASPVIIQREIHVPVNRLKYFEVDVSIISAVRDLGALSLRSDDKTRIDITDKIA